MLYIGNQNEALDTARRISENVSRTVNVWQYDMSRFIVAYDYQTVQNYSLYTAFRKGCSVEKV